MEKDKVGEELTTEDILGAISSLEGIDADATGNTVDGEYKEYGFVIDENKNVTVSEKLKGAKPEGIAYVLTQEEGLEEVEIQVMGKVEDGEIASIEALDGAILKEDKSSTEKIFKVNDNGTYTFRISGSNGRKIKVSCKVTNAIPPRDDLITAIARNDNRKNWWRNKENKSKRENK